ncbi:MAG: DUF3307 domain-containing protein [Hyphomicrobiales bacterium]
MSVQLLPLLVLIALLQFKHFVADGPLQTAAMVRDKGHYGRPLGLLHAGLHGVGTAIALLVAGVGLKLTVVLAVMDTLIHYHVDFSKETLVRLAGWTPKDAPFWWAISADQLLHQYTYLLVAWIVFTNA